MKKILLLAFAAAAALMMASCQGDGPVNPDPNKHPAVIKANYTNLTKGNITGEEVKVLPVSASSEAGSLDLKFYTDKIYLPAGTYTLGSEVGNYSGHFKNDWVDADIVGGLINVVLDGEEDYSINGTVRLANEEGTAVKIRSNGKMVYEFPTEYYYTETKDANVYGYKANVYKIYDIATSVQIAEFALAGAENGDFQVTGTGAAGTALYGSANAGCWFFEPGFGTHIMVHGSVSVSQSHGKKNFVVSDTRNASFTNCELKQDIVPALPSGGGDVSFMMVSFFSVESPVVDGMYELTIKLNYTDGSEFISLTGLVPSPNPILEALQKDGDSTGGMPFSSVSYDDYLAKPSSRCAIQPTIFYVINGVKYDLPMDSGFTMVVNFQKVSGIVAGLVAPTNMAYALPGPLNDFMTSIGNSIWGMIGYYF